MKQFYLICYFILSALAFNFYDAKAATWNESGAYDITWFKKSQTEFTLNTPQQLAGLAYLVNNNYTTFKNITIKLDSNIDLSGKVWIPIKTFQGTIDGNGHTIFGFYVSYDTGFFDKLSDAGVYNINFTGTLSASGTSFGLISSYASNTIFENIYAESTINYEITKVGGSTSKKYMYYIGGCVAQTSNCSFKNIVCTSKINFEFGNTNGNNCYGNISIYAGGIVGSAQSTSFVRCQSVNDCSIGINGYVTDTYYTDPGAGAIYYGGIVGSAKGDNSKVSICYSQLNNFSGRHYNGTYDGTAFYVGGIIGNTYNLTVEDCIAIIDKYSITGHAYSWVASWYHTASCFGGIAAKVERTNFYRCYYNNDVNKSISKVRSNTTSDYGSNAFSSAQMNSMSFINEVNFFTQMEFDRDLWGLDAGGRLMLLPENLNGIDIIINKKKKADVIYDINGYKLTSKQKGLNIIVDHNGKTKKVIR